MSLDFYVYQPQEVTCPHCNKEVSLTIPVESYWANYTHNVNGMWQLAGCYDALYNSEGKKAKEITAALKYGLYHMRNYPKLYEPLNPPNGWGDYESAMSFLEKIIAACVANPEGIIGVSK